MKKSQFNEIQVHWLTDPQADTSLVVLPGKGDMTRTVFPCPPELGQGWMDRLAISSDLVVHHVEYRFERRCRQASVPLGEFKIDFPETTLYVRTLHSGSMLTHDFQPQAEMDLSPGEDFFRHAEQLHFLPILHTASDIVMTGLAISDRALHELIGEGDAHHLLRNLGLDQPPVSRKVSIPLHVSAPLRQCLSSGTTGPLHALFAQSKILEYLWKLATFCKSAPCSSRPCSRGGDTIRALHDYLLHLEGEMPTLKELGRKFGESPQCLNKGFMQEYGQSIFAMLTSHRLNQSHMALLEGRLPIKTIATRLGYSHVNHFTHAFKMKFGYTPGSLRRKPPERV